MTYVVYGTFALCLVILFWLVRLQGTLREILDLAKRQHDVHVAKFRASVFGAHALSTSRHYTSIKGWAVWVHQDGKWKLEDDMCAPGFGPGKPPEIRGAYEGQRIKQEGVAR